MPYHPVVDQFALPIPLSPWPAALFVALFVATALLAARRPSWGLGALILLEPFAFARVFAGTSITLPKVALLGVLVGLTTYAGCAKRLRERPVPLLLGALGVYAAAMALSAAGAADRLASVHETIKVVEYAAFFTAAYLCYRVDPDDVPIVGAVAIGAIVVALSALVQEVIGSPSGLCVGLAIVPRIAGVLEGPNQLAGYFELAIATLGAWALVRRSSAIGLGMGLATFADMLTFSRAGFFGFVAVAAVLAIAGGKNAWRALRPAAIGLVAGLAGAGAWAFFAHSATVLRMTFDESVCAGGVGSRSDLWRAAWAMWLERPILGVGAGNFEMLLPQYGVLGVRTHANSWYLQSLAEGGIVLFAATIGLAVTIVTVFARRLRDGGPWVLAAFAGSLALSLHQIADYLLFYPKVGGPWWLLIGIAAGAIATRNARAAANANG